MSEDAIGLLRHWVLRQAGDHEDWLTKSLETLSRGALDRELHTVIGLAPRRLGKADLALTEAERRQAERALPGWQPGLWSLDIAARVLVLALYRGPQPMADTFRALRRTADAGELLALFRGLSLYPDPESLLPEAGEGLRTNVQAVFEAIAHHNPYPCAHFDQHRWNHMVLKALFIGSPLAPIVGLEERANAELARTLIDYARERRAAGRPVSPELWCCVAPFTSELGSADALEPMLTELSAEYAAANVKKGDPRC